MRQSSQRGAALVITMIVVVALMSLAALALYLQTADTKAAQYSTSGRGALYCAESGLAGAQDYVMNNSGSWNAMLDSTTSNDPAGYPVTGDLDGDGQDDWEVTIRDDEDEFPSDNPDVDSNRMVYIVATCLSYSDSPREIIELVGVEGGGTHYRNQSGQGASGSNNRN